MVTIREGRNRASPEEAASFASELDRYEQMREVKLHDLDVEFKAKKRAINKEIDEEQKPIYEDAKKQGVKKGTLRAIVDGQAAIRKSEEKLAAAKDRAREGLDDLEDEDRDQAVDIVRALGNDFAGFGLGAAAVAQEKIDKHKAGQQEDGGAEPDPVAAAAAKAWDDADPAKASGKAAKASKKADKTLN